MTATRERARYLASCARSSVSRDGWFGYAPVDHPVTWPPRWRQLLRLPATLRAANRAYSEELGR